MSRSERQLGLGASKALSLYVEVLASINSKKRGKNTEY